MAFRNIGNHLPDITVAQLRKLKHESPLLWIFFQFFWRGLELSHRRISLDLTPCRQVEIHRLHGGTYCHYLLRLADRSTITGLHGVTDTGWSSCNYVGAPFGFRRGHKTILRFFVLHLSSSGLIPGWDLDETMVASFQIYSNSFAILHWMKYSVDTNSIVT